MDLPFRIVLSFAFTAFCIIGSVTDSISQSHLDSLTSQIRSEIRARNYEQGWDLYAKLIREYEILTLPFDTTYGKASLFVAQSYIFSNKNEEAAEHYQRAIEIMEKDTFLPKIYTMQCYLGIGVAYKRMSQFNTAADYYHKAKDLVISTYGPDDRGLHNIYNNLGNVYRILGDFDASISSHEEAIRIRSLHYPPLDYHIGDSYNNLGLVYTDLNQNSKAIIHLKQALDHYQDNSISIQARAAQAGYNISRIYYNLANYEKCLEYLDPAIDLMEQAGGEKEFDYAEMLNTKTHLLIKTGQLIQAQEVLDQTIRQKSQYLREDHLNWTYTNNAAAELASIRGDYNEAEELYNRNLEIYQIHYRGFHPEKVQLWQKLLQNAINQDDLTSAEDCLDSLKLLINEPDIEFINKEYAEMLDHEEAKYLFYAFKKSNDVSILKRSADKAFRSIFPQNNEMKSVDMITQKLISGEDRRYADLAIKINEAAFNAANDDGYLNNTFKIADFQKSTILKEMVSRDRTISNSSLSENQQEKSFQLKSLLNQLRTEFYQDNNQLSVSKYDSLYNELHEIQSKIAGNNLTEISSEASDLSIDVEALINSATKEKAVFLSYYWSDDRLYIHRIDADGIQLSKTDFPDSAIINGLRDGLVKNNNSISESQEIYDLLLGNVLNDNDRDRKIIIIPDKGLHLIPYEVMKPSFLDDEYLINFAPVSYANSAEYWMKLKALKSKADKSILAFAPEYNFEVAEDIVYEDDPTEIVIREGNQRLKGGLASVEKISELLDCEVFVGSEATIDAFHQNADDYRILHFSMHAYDNTEDPLSSALIFEPNDSLGIQLLTARDIFNTDLSCDLAVLAACNTGWGQLNTSEGMQSLSYSFAYAGAKSTIMSLWRVPDEATAMIMQSFYSYLKEDHNKAEALRLAKLDYINSTVDVAQKYPYFWAGFILSGDTSPIELDPGYSFAWIVGFFLLAGLGLIMYRRQSPQ
ncbi:MAG: CHAT domain-containing protein [Saprospiraceae bacterium]|nr:CHAT domain-containing protein [Saprospiraceae bacterium]